MPLDYFAAFDTQFEVVGGFISGYLFVDFCAKPQLKNEIEQLARNGYGLIVVDPLWMYYRTSAGRELVDELTEEAKRSGVAILASNIWTIEGHEDNTLQIEHHKDFRHAYHGRNDGNVHLLVKAKAGDFSFRRIGDAVVYCSVD